MAGPFATTGNEVRDIERVQLRGGSTPDSGILGVAEAVLNVAVPALTEAHANSIKQDLTDQTESVKQALLAAQNPALRGSKFTEEALQNPITAEAFKQFNLIQDAAGSGKLPKQYALERLEEIQDTAIANNPAFEKEIRAAMVQATGVDPNKATFQQMLNKSEADLSPEAKADRRVRELARFHGISVREQLHMNNVGARNALAQNELDLKKADGSYSLIDQGKEVNLISGKIFMDMAGEVSAAHTAGRVTDEFIASMKVKIAEEVTAATFVLTQASSGVTGTQLEASLAPLKLMEERVIGMLEDGSYTDMVTNRVVFKKIMIEDKVMSMPDFAAAWALGDRPGFAAMIQYITLAPTEASEEAVAAMSPKIKSAFLLRNLSASLVANQYGKIGSGTKPETKDEKDAMRVASSIVIATDGVREEVKASAMQELRDLGKNYEWTVFESKKVAKATAKSQVLKAAFLNLQETTSAGLSAEFAQMELEGKTKHISMQGGKLVFDFAANTLEGRNSVATQRNIQQTLPGISDTSVQLGFIARFNTANSISLLHSQAGTLPQSRYTTSANYWDKIKTDFSKEAAEKSGQPAVKAPEQPVVIKYGRDASGKSVRLN